MDYGADIFIDDKTMDEWGSKAIHDAKTMGQPHVVAFLKPLMARVSREDRAGLKVGVGIPPSAMVKASCCQIPAGS